MVTRVWINHDTGAYAVEAHDGLWIGASKAKQSPDWINRDPNLIFSEPIEWHGGDNPTTPGQTVLCRFRGGGYYLGPSDPHSQLWTHAPARGRPNPAGDIVTYQVVENG